MPERTARPDQEHVFAALDDAVLDAVDVVDESEAPASLWQDAWRNLRRRPIFWVSVALIVVFVTMAIGPRLFTATDPRYCDLTKSLDLPGSGHPFGFDKQGCDVFARTIYGARASMLVGVLATLSSTLLGAVIGAIAGFYGRWFDALLSRATDIFFAIPLMLAAIVVMQMFKSQRGVFTVVLVLAVFGWPQIARITRGAVMGVKNADFVTAAKSLGASRIGTLVRHVMPNSLAPIIVTATVSLGSYVVLEATLSFLGVGLPPSVVSWGADISHASRSLRDQPGILLYPSVALALTVLGFIMLGDAVRDALDPKARKQ